MMMMMIDDDDDDCNCSGVDGDEYHRRYHSAVRPITAGPWGRGYHRRQEDAISIGCSRVVDSFGRVDWVAQQVADGRLAEVAGSVLWDC